MSLPLFPLDEPEGVMTEGRGTGGDQLAILWRNMTNKLGRDRDDCIADHPVFCLKGLSLRKNVDIKPLFSATSKGSCRLN